MRKLFIEACQEVGVSKGKAEAAYRFFLENMKKELAEGGSVVIRGVGTLKKEKRQGRKIYSPSLDKVIDVPDRELIVFKRSKAK